jgi:hypothetical protein
VGILHPRPGGGEKLDRCAIEGDGDDIVEREGMTIEHDWGRHAGNVSRAARQFKGAGMPSLD